MTETLADLVKRLKENPTRPVRATVDGFIVELRAVDPEGPSRSAADVFEELGPWAGESTDEMLELLAEARRRGGRRAASRL